MSRTRGRCDESWVLVGAGLECSAGRCAPAHVAVSSVASGSTEGAVRAERHPMDPSAATTTRTNCETIVGRPLNAGQHKSEAQMRRRRADRLPRANSEVGR